MALVISARSSVNASGFALLPAYLSAFVGLDDGERGGNKAVAIGKALKVSAVLTAGFVTVFGLFGAVITRVLSGIEEYLPWATIVIGIGLVGLGVYLLTGRQLIQLRARVAPERILVEVLVGEAEIGGVGFLPRVAELQLHARVPARRRVIVEPELAEIVVEVVTGVVLVVVDVAGAGAVAAVKAQAFSAAAAAFGAAGTGPAGAGAAALARLTGKDVVVLATLDLGAMPVVGLGLAVVIAMRLVLVRAGELGARRKRSKHR